MSRRTRVIEGVYQDRYGLAACVKLRGVQREKRFAADTPLEILESWRIQTRADLDSESPQDPRAVAGSLQRDGLAFLKRKQGRVSYAADRSHLKAWFATFGHRSRRTITRDELERQIALWRSGGVSARTIRHRLRVLRECFQAFDGPKARTALEYIKLPPPPAPSPTAVPLKTIRKVAKALKKAQLTKDYARFLVRATTGQRPAQIMRATADDLDLRRRIWFVRPAKGGTPIPMPLNADMIAAWKYFAKAKAWGEFDTGRAADVLRAYGWPEDVRPYDLRHTFAIDLLLSGADLGDVQGLLGHSQIQTTRLHYAPILTARLRRVTDRRRLKLA